MEKIRELRAELGHVCELLADARAREVSAVLAAFKEQVELYRITEDELLAGLGFKKKTPKLPVKYYDPETGNKWTGQGSVPKWLRGKNLNDYHVDSIRPEAKPWWPELNAQHRARRAHR